MRQASASTWCVCTILLAVSFRGNVLGGSVIPTCFCTIRSAHVTRHFEAQSPTWRSGKNARRGRNARRLKMRMIRQVVPVVPLGSLGSVESVESVEVSVIWKSEHFPRVAEALLKLPWIFPATGQQLVVARRNLLEPWQRVAGLRTWSQSIWQINTHLDHLACKMRQTYCNILSTHTHTYQHDMLLSASISIQGYIGGSCTCSCPIDQDFGRCYPLPDMVFERWHYGQEAKGPDGMGREGMMAWWQIMAYFMASSIISTCENYSMIMIMLKMLGMLLQICYNIYQYIMLRICCLILMWILWMCGMALIFTADVLYNSLRHPVLFG